MQNTIQRDMKSFGGVNIFLTCVLTITLIALTFFSIIHSNFKDVPSMLSFLERANVYNNASTLIKLEIQENYPATIRNNIILRGLTDELVKVIITPQLVAKVAKPALQASVAFAQSPTAIIDDKVVISTSPYKAQARQVVGDFGLPNIMTKTVGLLINALPSQLTLVDLQKRPNSVLGMIIKARTILAQNNAARVSSWVVLIGVLLVSIFYNLRHVKKLIESLIIICLVSSGVFILLWVLIPVIFGMILPAPLTSIITAQNALVTDAVVFLVKQMMFVSLYYLALGIVLIVILKLVKFDRAQKKFDKLLHKLHIPTVSVEVKPS